MILSLVHGFRLKASETRFVSMSSFYSSSLLQQLVQLLLLSLLLLVVNFQPADSSSVCSCAVPRDLGCACRCTDGSPQIRCIDTGFTDVPTNFSNPTGLTITGSRVRVLSKVTYPTLLALRLPRNGIVYVEDDAFLLMDRLTVLSLSHNQISVLTERTFVGLRRLELLSLEGNNFLEIGSLVFAGTVLPRLAFLKLSNSKIHSIELNSFAGLKNLRQLNLTGNAIRELPVLGDATKLARLSELDLSNNRLTFFNGSSLQHLTALRHLFLSGNSISEVHGGFFSPTAATTLSSLWLRQNRIERVSQGVLRQMESLKILDLAHNSIQELDASELPWNSLQKIFVHDNPWNCSLCRNQWIVKNNLVRHSNQESELTCGAPVSEGGLRVASRSAFENCWPEQDRAAQTTRRPGPSAALSRVLGISALLWAACIVAILVVICRRRSQVSPIKEPEPISKNSQYDVNESSERLFPPDNDDAKIC